LHHDEICCVEMKIASVCVLGNPAQQSRSTRHRLKLVERVVSALIKRRGWGDLDALLFPAGFIRSSDWFGPLSSRQREKRFSRSDWGQACRTASHNLSASSPGCVVVVGVDTGKPNRYWRGDQMIVAFDASGPVAWARKIFPVSSDTDEGWRCPILLFEQDFADERRFFQLPSGEIAVLSVCYDAFVYRELVKGPTSKRRAMRFLGLGVEEWATLPRPRADQFLKRYQKRLDQMRPSVNLVGIHQFQRPGSEIFWQRHGISTASAALGGILTVGAAHFSDALPLTTHRSPLASSQVSWRQLGPGPERLAEEHSARRQLIIRDTSSGPPGAIVRLFTAV
jgi:hypothetical protein